MPKLIDLAIPRKIVFREGATEYSYQIAPIAEALWFKYFDSIVSTAERKGNELVQRIDATSAGVELVDKVLVETVSISLKHRLAIANVLTSAFVSDEDEIDQPSGSEVVALRAIWSAGDDGRMLRHKNLLHKFSIPTAEQNRRYRRDDSRAQIVGGSRRGITVYHGAQRTLATLYDELIEGVSGYVVNGLEFPDRATIVRHMDTYHKVSAVAKLFAATEIDVVDVDEDEDEY